MTLGGQCIRVDLGARSYDIAIGQGLAKNSAAFFQERAPFSHAVVITDGNVETPHGRALAETLAEAGASVDLVVVEPGETSKSVPTAVALWEKMLELEADRKTAVVAVGGGVIGDLAGFIAATYARGLPFFQVPTSLLAQVDSSVGGKVGINLPKAKNMVGAFLQPRGVLIDTETLHTLPDREYRSGLAEVVKYGVILDADFFAYLEAHVEGLLRREADVLVPTIARCCRLKADIVQQDELEQSGLRAVLNYGHTFGHALETLSGYGGMLHGEAVAVGMVCASRLAELLGRIDPELTERQRRLLWALGLPTEVPPCNPDELLRIMRHDKKAAHGQLRFVLPSRLGHVELVGGVDEALVRRACAPGPSPAM